MKKEPNGGSTRWKIERKFNKIRRNHSKRNDTPTQELAERKDIISDEKVKKSLGKRSKSKNFTFKKSGTHKMPKKTVHNHHKIVNKTENGEQKSSDYENITEEDIKNDAVKLSKFEKKTHPNFITTNKENKDSVGRMPRFDHFRKKSIIRADGMEVPSFDKVKQEFANNSNIDTTSTDLFGVDEESNAQQKVTTHIVFAERVAEENSTSSNKNATVDNTNLSNETLSNNTSPSNKTLINKTEPSNETSSNDTSLSKETVSNKTSKSNETSNDKKQDGKHTFFYLFIFGLFILVSYKLTV